MNILEERKVLAAKEAKRQAAEAAEALHGAKRVAVAETEKETSAHIHERMKEAFLIKNKVIGSGNGTFEAKLRYVENNYEACTCIASPSPNAIIARLTSTT